MTGSTCEFRFQNRSKHIQKEKNQFSVKTKTQRQEKEELQRKIRSSLLVAEIDGHEEEFVTFGSQEIIRDFQQQRVLELWWGKRNDAEWIKGPGGLGKSSVEHRPLPEHVSPSGARE